MAIVFSSVHVERTATLEGLREGIGLALERGAKSLLIFLCSRPQYDLQQLPALFAELPVPVFAGVFPGIIHDQEHFHDGALICGMTLKLTPCLVEDIDRPDELIAEELAQCFPGASPAGALLLIDGQSRGIDNFVACLYDRFGPDTTVFGAGAGYLDFSHNPCLVTASGVYQNAAMVIGLPVPLAFGVHHGWESIAGPFLVTGSEGNRIQSINYQPAFSFYRDILEGHAGQALDFSDFFSVAKSYPFGMAQLDSEYLVRDPIRSQGEVIECAGSISPNTMVYILHAKPPQLIAAAAQATLELRPKLAPNYESAESLYAMVVDCISRELFLGPDYPAELASIQSALPQATLIAGILSLGEIASSSQGVIHFLNKTTVIGGAGR
jgi:hypothetical protein